MPHPTRAAICLSTILLCSCGGGAGGGAPANTAPTIATLANRVVSLGQIFSPVTIAVGDDQTAASSLVVVASSDSPSVVPASGLVLTGDGTERILTIMPAAGVLGTATISVRVTDAAGLSTIRSFAVTIEAATNAPAPVPVTGANVSDAPGDDGDVRPGTAYPSPRFTDSGDGTITDNATGLVWLKNADAFGNLTWTQALDACAALANGQSGISDGSAAGQWRLPQREELASLLYFGPTSGAALPQNHPFTNPRSTAYWTGNSYALQHSDAWIVWMSDGAASLSDKSTSQRALWPVRTGTGGAPIPVARTGAVDLPGYVEDAREDGATRHGVAWPAPRFTDLGDGTVRDNLTGLVWLRNANPFGTRTWTQALRSCAGLSHGSAGLTDGSSTGDWRLPTVRELRSLLCLGYYLPALSDAAGTGQWTEGSAFTAVQSDLYWTSTSSEFGGDGSAWHVNLYVGSIGMSAASTSRFVWPVRNGTVMIAPTAITHRASLGDLVMP